MVKFPHPNEWVSMHTQKCETEHTLVTAKWDNKDLEIRVIYYFMDKRGNIDFV